MAVVNVKTAKKGSYVYIGRPSKFGNPFVIGRDGTREEVIAKYRRWLWERVKHDSKFQIELAKLAGRDLGCYCAPLPCHGDVLAKAAEWAQDELDRCNPYCNLGA